MSFMTDPKNMDYTAEAGAQRNFEPWRENHIEEVDERLQRLEAEAAGAEADAMQDLETKMLDEICAVNARAEIAADISEASLAKDIKDEQREREKADDAKAARKAF
jgi:Saf4/Yju2 protein